MPTSCPLGLDDDTERREPAMDDDWDEDDWELDDWEEDSFDDDEDEDAEAGWGPAGTHGWDPAEDDWDPAEETAWSSGAGGGGGAGFARGGSPGGAAPSEPAVSAWDVGAGFALAGWLLDRHADRIERAVGDQGELAAQRAAPPPPPPAQSEAAQANRAVPVAAPTGEPIDWTSAPLAPGESLTRSGLAVRLTTDAAQGAETALTLEPVGAPALSIVLIVTALTPPHRFWVVADERAEGFTSARLLPVFATDGDSRRAIHRTVDPAGAVDALEWAYAREGFDLAQVRWRDGRPPRG